MAAECVPLRVVLHAETPNPETKAFITKLRRTRSQLLFEKKIELVQNSPTCTSLTRKHEILLIRLLSTHLNHFWLPWSSNYWWHSNHPWRSSSSHKLSGGPPNASRRPDRRHVRTRNRPQTEILHFPIIKPPFLKTSADTWGHLTRPSPRPP